MRRREMQSRFVQMQALLIAYATMLGYELTLGSREAKHNPKGFHYKQLAEDYNLFIDGVYKRGTEVHRPLGEFWKFIGGTWGGDFKKPDGNHYSYGE